jgi:NAD(P)-dependent dehydrogenase (short-subunit alcohol dehydrogenase family)
MISTTAQVFGSIDIMVNSAGMFGSGARIMDMRPEEWDKTIEIDLLGTIRCCNAVIPEMKKHYQGKIINVSSASSFLPVIGMSAYSTAKAGVTMMTKALAMQVANYNIQVNALSPGYFLTPMNQGFFNSEPGKKVINSWPLKRPGSLDQLKGIVVFLASSASDYMTGSEILIDGGQTLPYTTGIPIDAIETERIAVPVMNS